MYLMNGPQYTGDSQRYLTLRFVSGQQYSQPLSLEAQNRLFAARAFLSGRTGQCHYSARCLPVLFMQPSDWLPKTICCVGMNSHFVIPKELQAESKC